MQPELTPLFAPFAIGSLSLANRIVMAPMTRAFTDAGVPHDAVSGYYAARARGGAGLLLTEGVVVDRPAAKNSPNIPNFHGPALDRWGEVFGAVHAVGGKIAPQIWHMGAVGYSSETYRPEPVDSPSGIALQNADGGEPMSEETVADTIAAFANAASSAVALGADAIEIHAAHGYLVDQFFWSHTNRRGDGWGGPAIGDRVRFGVALVCAIRAVMPADLPLLMRVSQWKLHHYEARIAETPADLEAWLGPLANAGVDIFHCSQRRYWDAEFSDSDLNLAGWAKRVTGRATITVGSVGLTGGDFVDSLFAGEHASPASLSNLLARLDRGEFDLVSVGRAMIANPDWANKVRNSRFEQLVPFERAMLSELR